MRLPALILLAVVARAAEPAEGRWEGTIEIPGSPLAAVIDLAQSGGEWIGSATVPGFIKGAQLAGLVVQSSALSFTLKGALGDPKFTGQVADGAITGSLVQAGNTAPVHLRRTGTPQVDLPRQSTPVTAGLEGEWRGEFVLNGNPIKATLTLTNQPAGKATAKFLVVGRRETNIPIDLVRQEGDFVTVVSSQYRISWEGRLEPARKELTGTFAQGPIETPLNLRRPQ
jgi:hypothetical protein